MKHKYCIKLGSNPTYLEEDPWNSIIIEADDPTDYYGVNRYV